MEIITFTCETITPMFLAGADGSTPEFRASSIKGAMRFWWRALHGHLPIDSQVLKSNTPQQKITFISKGLRDQEADIFGGAGAAQNDGKRSSFALQVKPGTGAQFHEHKLVPHKDYGFKGKAFDKKTQFEVIFRIQQTGGDYSVIAPVNNVKTEIFNREKLISLFQLTVFLGGLGRRVRRGMGSFQVVGARSSIADNTVELFQPSIADLHQLVGQFSPNYSLLSNGIIQNTYTGRMERFPWIMRIEIGRSTNSVDALTRKISDATHDVKQKHTREYEPSLGHSFNGRFASPVYVSVLADSRPIITTLNTVPDRDVHLISLNVQQTFKSKIL